MTLNIPRNQTRWESWSRYKPKRGRRSSSSPSLPLAKASNVLTSTSMPDNQTTTRARRTSSSRTLNRRRPLSCTRSPHRLKIKAFSLYRSLAPGRWTTRTEKQRQATTKIHLLVSWPRLCSQQWQCRILDLRQRSVQVRQRANWWSQAPLMVFRSLFHASRGRLIIIRVSKRCWMRAKCSPGSHNQRCRSSRRRAQNINR